jgi:ribonuclease/clavin/mitogillin
MRYGEITRIRMARTILLWDLHDTSAFVVDGMLIDTGPPATVRELLGYVRGRGIDKIVITHHHEDHVGGAATLSRELGVPVLAPGPAIGMLSEGLRIPLYRKVVFDGAPLPFRAEPLGESVEAGPYRFRVVPTPGHSADHVCLFEETRRWLFTGDLYVHERVTMFRRIEDVWQHMDSLRRVLALGPELLVCSQSGFFVDARLHLERKIRYWERLEREARALSERGMGEREITRRLLGREGLRTYASGFEFSKRRLIRGLLSGGHSPPRNHH